MAGFTVAQLEALEAAIGSGELTVKYDGKEVTYRDMDDLIKARDLVKAELAEAGLLPAQTSRVAYAAHSRD